MPWVDIADLRGTQGPAGSFQKGVIPSGSNINNWASPQYEGAWTVSSTTSAGLVTGLPITAAGTLMNFPGIGSQFYMAYGNPATFWFRGVNNVASGSWGSWENLTEMRTLGRPGLMPEGTNLNYWYLDETAGEWAINSTTVAQTMYNLPVVAAGRLINRPDGISSQIFISYGTDPGYWFRAITNVVTKAWGPWNRLNSGGGTGGGGAALEHQVRADTVRKSMGYKIGTGGKGVFMLRLDDYPQDLASKVLPVIRANHIPAYFACTVRWVEELQSTPWSTIQSWCLNDGMQIWGHSWTHSAASSTGALKKEIIESADYFETNMPRVRVPGWVMPGTGISVDPYGGYNGKTDADFYGTEAGQMILSRYGIVNGARTGYLQPIGGGHPVGQSHQTMDSMTVAEFKAHVQAAIDDGRALSFMLHPGHLDGSGHMTTVQFRECMEWVAQERAGGRLLTLTGNASAVLDQDSNTRDNLLPGSFGGNLRGWTGWTLNGSGNPSSSGTATLTFGVDLNPVGWARGSTRELHAVVKATASSVIRVTVTSTDLNTTADYTIPANTWVDVRKYLSIPVTGSSTLTVNVQRVSGGTVEVQQANLYAA